MSSKENVLQGSKGKSHLKLMSHKSNVKKILDSIVNELFFCDQ